MALRPLPALRSNRGIGIGMLQEGVPAPRRARREPRAPEHGTRLFSASRRLGGERSCRFEVRRLAILAAKTKPRRLSVPGRSRRLGPALSLCGPALGRGLFPFFRPFCKVNSRGKIRRTSGKHPIFSEISGILLNPIVKSVTNLSNGLGLGVAEGRSWCTLLPVP